MNNILKLSAVALIFTAVAGCSTAPGQAVSNLTSAFDYKTGIHVTDAQLAGFNKGKTTKNDVINTVGHPPQKTNVSGMEVWTYTYTHLPMIPFAKGAFENTVFEFKGNTLHNAYKSAGTPGRSGNPMLDAAGL